MNIQKNNLHEPLRTLITSVIFAVCCLIAARMIETGSIFGNMVALGIFLVVLPLLYVSMIHHDSWKDFFEMPKDVTVSLIIGTVIALIMGFVTGVINSYLVLDDEVIEVAEALSQSFTGFILYEFLVLLPVILSVTFFGYFFVKYIFHDYKFLRIIAPLALSALLFFVTTLPLSVMMPLIIVSVLNLLRRDQYVVVVWSLFLAYFIFDAMIIKTIL